MKKVLVSSKIWPRPLELAVHEESLRDAYWPQQMNNRPGQPRSRRFPRAYGFVDSRGTIDKNDRESFHCAIGSILGVAQCFGILPLAGVRSESPRKLLFKIYSWRMVYAIVIMVMLLTMVLISIYHLIQLLKSQTSDNDDYIAASAQNTIFYGNVLFATAFFTWLASRWESLQLDWRAVEEFLDRDKHQSPRLRWKFSTLTAVVMFFALLEHILSILKNASLELLSSTAMISTFQDFLQSYCEKSHTFVFSVCNYNVVVGICVLCINTVGTFTWNFTDMFVILVSTGLAERYATLNQRLNDNTSTCRSNVDWPELRESYAALSRLVKSVDDNISPLILLSFANNLYFICLQLFNGLSPEEGKFLSTIYFFGSFAFLVSRTVTVTIMTARINEQSNVALPALYNCPGRSYNIETQRLQQQLATDEVCLTGMKFFSVTRNFMLTIASVIVTYEVVLLQLNASMPKK